MRDETEQLSLINEQEENNKPVVCLGITFKNVEARREYFRKELEKKLPELKELEGFPIGKDADIIELSDPPYYTACPNPWINEFIEEWENEKISKYGRQENEKYQSNLFAADVSEGKNDPIYYAHSYHTKVPHKAIMRYMLNYTKPGDIILDSFSGTGMTGIAAQLCGNIDAVKDLNFQVESEKIFEEGKYISDLGERKAILNDLSPNATFISRGYNFSLNKVNELEIEMKNIMKVVFNKLGHFYQTVHDQSFNQQKEGTINYIIWSDVFICPSCSAEIIFYEAAINKDDGKVKDEIECQECSSHLKKRSIKRAYENVLDYKSNQINLMAKQVPAIINYTYMGKRYNKKPDENDLRKIKEIEMEARNYWYPTNKLPKGYNTKQPANSHGYTHAHHFYTARNLITLAVFFNEIKSSPNQQELLFILSSIHIHVNKMRRYQPVKPGGTPGLPGTLFVSSLNVELSIFDVLPRKIRDMKKAMFKSESSVAINTGSATELAMNNDSVDYIFTDPPFGSNLMYSELNFLWEAWLKVRTNNKSEAIVNSMQKKNLSEYQLLMEFSFKEYYRVLKPGRWMTVEFSNSQANVWNSIQEAIQKAGFVIANVAALDKKQGSFKAVTSTTAVKQDLVISAYKPTDESVKKIIKQVNTNESAWTFVGQHLEKLPVFFGAKGEASIIVERTPRILFDRMVAYHVQNGLPVPISSSEFQEGVSQRFPMRDGMAFLESQVAEYDKKRTLVKEFSQMSLFVSDENSAIEWLRQQLMKKPQTRQDLHPLFMKEIQHISKHELLPELDSLLLQNFLKYEGDGIVPDQLVSYLQRNYREFRGVEKDDEKLKAKALNRWYVPNPNKQADLEKLRERTLLREFESYTEELAKNNKKLRQFRTEAIRAGFKKAWSEKDYGKIVSVGDRLPEAVIQEDDKLLMYYDNAQVRLDM